MPSLQEIADATGLSPSTISRVLRGHGDVSDTTREQVRKELRRLGYPLTGRFSRRGRPAKQSASALVAVVCEDHGLIRKEPFFAPIAAGALAVSGTLGVRCVPVDWPKDRADPPSELSGVDGAVFVDEAAGGSLEAFAKRVPSATVDRYRPGTGADGVVADYRQGVFEAVGHLLAKGHRRLALLSASRAAGDGFYEQIYDGARRALDLAGQPIPDDLVAGHCATAEEGFVLAQRLLARQARERPTALVGNDHSMIGALRALHDLGMKVPEDVAVVGVDGIEMGAYAVPRLSTVYVDKEGMGKAAVERVLWRIKNPAAPPCRIVTDTKLMLRDSC